jgi:ferritin-like protein
MHLDLERLDRDGALREAAAGVPSETRKDFLLGTLAGGGAALAALVLAEPGKAASKTDVDILNYALTLEYLQAAFYTEAERRRALRTYVAKQTARVLGAVERAHVRALRDALGESAVARPFFDFGGTTEDEDDFIRTAVAFEDLGTAAYKGQAYRIDSPALLSAAISIHSVEARHAAWIRYLAGAPPASSAFDEPKSMPEVRRLVASTGFIVQRPRTRSRGEPRFTG